jgi:hypothetical protein
MIDRQHCFQPLLYQVATAAVSKALRFSPKFRRFAFISGANSKWWSPTGEPLITYLNSGTYPHAAIIVPNRSPAGPVASRRWNDVDRFGSIVARLGNRGAE